MATTPRKPGRCTAQRQRLFDLLERILEVQDKLSNSDLPPAVIARLEAQLARLQGQRPERERQLRECEARKPPAPKKTAAKKRRKAA